MAESLTRIEARESLRAIPLFREANDSDLDSLAFHLIERSYPKDAIIVRPATIEAVVLEPIDTSQWTRKGLDGEIQAIRARYREVLGEGGEEIP